MEQGESSSGKWSVDFSGFEIKNYRLVLSMSAEYTSRNPTPRKAMEKRKQAFGFMRK